MLDHTEILNEIETRSRLEKFFSLSADKPTVLLVFDENHTRDVLKSVGIDTSKWQSGLSNLLYRREEKFESRRNYPMKERERSSRSRSPRRYSGDYCDSKYDYVSRNSRPRSPDSRSK